MWKINNNKEKCLHELQVRKKYLNWTQKAHAIKKIYELDKVKLEISVQKTALTEWKGKQKKLVNALHTEIFREGMMTFEMY